MRELTEKQAAVLRYIRQHLEERGYPPTIREIGKHFGIRSTNGVTDHLRRLEAKGAITRDFMKSRAILPTTGPGSDVASAQVSPVRGPPPDAVEVDILAHVGHSSERVVEVVRIDPRLLRLPSRLWPTGDKKVASPG